MTDQAAEPALNEPEREANLARRWPWLVWVGTLVVLASAATFESMLTGSFDVGEAIFLVLAVVSFATVGALITSRQAGNRVGFLFAWVGASAAIAVAGGSYASLALERSLPLVAPAAWIGRVGFAAMFGPIAFLCLIFPTGEPPSRRWGWVLHVMLVAYAINLIGLALTPGPVDAGFSELGGAVDNPLGLPGAWREAIEVITGLAGLTVLAGGLISIISLIQRFRRASEVERQQIRWLLFLTAFLGGLLTTMLLLQLIGVFPEDEESFIGNTIFFVFIIGLFIGIPVTSAIAILRYRLYDLDLVVKKTILYFVLVALIVVVASIGAFLLGSLFVADDLSPGSLILIGIVAGVLLWPLRRLAVRISDRLVYGGRTTSYEAMTTFAHRVGDAYTSEDVLPRMATILKETTRADGATVWLRIGPRFVPAASVGNGSSSAPVDARGDTLPKLPADHAAPVSHHGELLGALGVTMPANDPIDRSRERLVDDLASQAGAVVRNVRLIEELRASRQRLVAAQDEERRRIERNLHDGAQQQLIALAVKTRLAQQLADRDAGNTASLLEAIQRDAESALDDLRGLARGIYPPLLADQGLGAALEAQARRAPIPVEVDVTADVRYPQAIEAAVYFCCLEALNNIAKYANASRAIVRIARDDGQLRFEVEDDGKGFDVGSTTHGTGLQGMADRLDALGGRFEVTSAPGSGTTISGTLTLGQM